MTRRPGFLVYGLLAAFIVGSALPLYWSFLIGSHTKEVITRDVPPLLPGGHFLSNAQRVFDSVPFWKALGNSLMVSSVAATSVVIFGTLAGYAFAKLRFRGSTALLVFVVVTMAVPTQLGVVPLFIVMAKLGWTGSVWAAIVPSIVTAFGVFFMRQYLVQALPDELLDAAKVDGATALRTVWSVVLPIARPGMAVLGMLTFMTAWNDFFWPVIALDTTNPTVQVALAALGGGYVPDTGVIMAGTLVGTLPVVVVFLLLGRQIVGGIVAGAVKA